MIGASPLWPLRFVRLSVPGHVPLAVAISCPDGDSKSAASARAGTRRRRRVYRPQPCLRVEQLREQPEFVVLSSIAVPTVAAAPQHPRWSATLADDPTGQRLTIRDFDASLYDRGLDQAPTVPPPEWVHTLQRWQRLSVLLLAPGETLPWGPHELDAACRDGRVIATTVPVSLATSGLMRQPALPRPATGGQPRWAGAS